jgi:hypothetical protein
MIRKLGIGFALPFAGGATGGGAVVDGGSGACGDEGACCALQAMAR